MTPSPPVLWHHAGDDVQRADRLAREFTQLYGTEPAGVWAAPGRVNLIGEHVDYAGGLCVPLALPHTTLVAASGHPGARVAVRSRQRPGEPVDVEVADVGAGVPAGWGAYVAGVAAVLARQTGRPTGLRALVDSTVPVGAGLSSSAALSCATALALDDLQGLGLGADDAGRARLADACVRAENEVALAPTGGMDQAAALRCQEGSVLLLDCRDGGVTHLPLDLAPHDLALLVVDTRAAHTHTDGGYARRRAAVEEAGRRLGVSSLREHVDDDVDEVLASLPVALRPPARHVLTEVRRVREAAALLRTGRLSELGPLLDASHASLRDDLVVSSPELDLAVSTAGQAGALGARMTGGGFGGSALALVPVRRLEAVVADVQASFDGAGLLAPAFLVAQPSAGAHRVR